MPRYEHIDFSPAQWFSIFKWVVYINMHVWCFMDDARDLYKDNFDYVQLLPSMLTLGLDFLAMMSLL